MPTSIERRTSFGAVADHEPCIRQFSAKGLNPVHPHAVCRCVSAGAILDEMARREVAEGSENQRSDEVPPGQYTYFCIPHESLGMIAHVTVTP